MSERVSTSAARSTQRENQVSTQAAEWIVRLTADREDERAAALAGFEHWKSVDAQHAQAARRIEGFIVQVHALRDGTDHRGRAARAALDATRPPQTSRRSKSAARAFALALAVGLPVWLALHVHSPAHFMADLRTPTGRWASSTLDDGTRLTLNSATAVNLRLGETRRTLELVDGEIMVDVAHDATRPFWVETEHGRIRALGTRFVVRREDGATVLTMLESKALAQAATPAAHAAQENASPGMVVAAGQRVRIQPDRVEALEGADPRSVANAWEHHQLVADDRPLREVLDELNRHRPGTIRYSRQQLDGIKVSAVLPLDDTDRALQLLATSLPSLRVRTITPYIVIVDTAPAR